MIENDEIIRTIINLEKKYVINQYNGIDSGTGNIKIMNGTIPIILSAPHAVKQTRNGTIKKEDVLTGAIVEYLCKKTGVNGIIRSCNYNDDPNYYNEGQSLKYKDAILECIKRKNIAILIDIHGCSNKHEFDIELGTNNGKNINQNTELLEILNNEFSKISKVSIDEKFRASKSTTVSNYINTRSGIPCIQMEISSALRKEKNSLIKLLSAFEYIIESIKIQTKGDRNSYDEACR